MTQPGKGILAMDESNATCGSRLEGVGVENNEENRRRYRELLITTPALGEHIGGAILSRRLSTNLARMARRLLMP